MQIFFRLIFLREIFLVKINKYLSNSLNSLTVILYFYKNPILFIIIIKSLHISECRMIINILKELSNNPSNLINSSQKKKKNAEKFLHVSHRIQLKKIYRSIDQ